MTTATTRKNGVFPALLRFALISSLLVSILLFSGPPAKAAPPAPDASGFVDAKLPPEALTAPILVGAARPGSSKMEAVLVDVAFAARTSKTEALQQAQAGAVRVMGERVQVQVTTDAGRADAATEAIRQAGGEVSGWANGDTWLQAWLPVAALDTISQDASVDYLGLPAEAVTMVTTEGAAVINAPAWNTAGFKGAGVKVAVIDAGFIGYKALKGTELPSNVIAKDFVDGETDAQADTGTEHGTACAEVVHDIAPNATIFLVKVNTNIDLEEAVNWAKAQGANIISTSLGWYNLTPGDGTGFFANLVQSARSAGILWATAASNDREAHWGGAFNGNADGWHQFASGQIIDYFGPGNGNAYNIPAGYSIRAMLRWDDWTAKNQNYDVFIVRWNGTTWQTMGSGGQNQQNGGAGQTPTEFVSATSSGSSTPYGIAIRRISSNRNVNLEVFAPKVARLDKIVTARSLANLADSPAAITVAALDVKSPYPQESYSSEGPTNGPGGTATGGAVKPDIAGFANVATVSYPNNTFNGTSSATPHVAGAAALVKGANPGWSPAQIQSFLEGRAIDMGTAGKDTLFGWGRLNLGTPPQVNPPGNKKTFLPFVSRPMDAPVLNSISPSGSGNYTVSWSSVNGATSYVLQEAASGDFAAPATLNPGGNTSFPMSGKGPGTYYYRVRAVGAGTASGWSNVQFMTISSGSAWNIILSDGFEGSFPGPWQLWSPDASSWGKRNCQAASGGNSAWAVGGSGLSCGSSYPNNVNAWLYYGPFSLSDATAAEIKYKLWANTESGSDHLCVMASVDDNDYFGTCGSGNSNGWIDRTFDFSNVYQLGDLRGRPQVWVAFTFSSDGSVTYPEGAHVDDVLLHKCTSGACTANAPAVQSAGLQVQTSPVRMTRPK